MWKAYLASAYEDCITSLLTCSKFINPAHTGRQRGCSSPLAMGMFPDYLIQGNLEFPTHFRYLYIPGGIVMIGRCFMKSCYPITPGTVMVYTWNVSKCNFLSHKQRPLNHKQVVLIFQLTADPTSFITFFSFSPKSIRDQIFVILKTLTEPSGVSGRRPVPIETISEIGKELPYFLW